jgi:hypothetical protein
LNGRPIDDGADAIIHFGRGEPIARNWVAGPLRIILTVTSLRGVPYARIEALADAGGVFVSNTVHDHVRDRLPFAFEDLGEQQVKNIARPVRVYRVRPEGPLCKRMEG